MSATDTLVSVRAPSTGRIMLASLVGTAVEFYDFYAYGTAAALVLGPTFFPPGAPGVQRLAAFLTFGIAFLARPLGSFLFGHFGDRWGRKSTLVASLLVMGVSTTLIGVLPPFSTAGMLAPVLLCVLRFGQGLGLGGEWGGAALLATENAPAGRQSWFGMFPQLGPSVGFLMSNGLFVLLFALLTPAQFAQWGWRIPFLLSAVLVVIGLYARQAIGETAAFRRLAAQGGLVRVPLWQVVRHHAGPLLVGSLAMVACYAVFYISTVFALDYGTRVAHIARGTFLGLLCLAVVVMAVATPVSAALADRWGPRPVLLASCVVAAASGFALAPLLGAGDAEHALLFLAVQLGLMGMLFAPMGALLPALFPAAVRYTGASAAYNLGGVLGASLAPFAASLLLARGGLPWVGFYLTAAAAISFVAVLFVPRRGAW